MKKIISLLLAIMLVASITIVSFSAATTNAPLTTTQKVSFTLTCNKQGYEFSVYKIADLITSNVSPYTVKYQPVISSSAVKAAIADGNISDADRAKILNELDKDTSLSGASIIGKYNVNSDGNTKTFSNLDQGLYYVRATNFPAGVKKVTNSAFALPYYTAESGWIYNMDSINLATKVEDNPPTIKKEITNSTKNNVNFTDVSLGDTVKFKIKSSTAGSVNTVNVLDFKLNSYVVTDLMSKGLTLNRDSVDVALEDASGNTLSTLATTNYEVKVSAEEGRDTSFTISLKKTYLSKTEFYSASYVVVTYSATLNKYAVKGAAGNPNTAVDLTYSNKNNVTSTIEGNTVYVYTYGAMVNKFNESSSKLAGAEFSLYKTQTDATDDKNAIATGKSDSNGKVVFKVSNGDEIKLQSGTYYIRETKAPTGYNRYTDIIPISISVGYNNTLTNGTYVKNAPVDGVATVDVKNSKTILPQTGGNGYALLFAISGTMLLAGMVLLLINRKKKITE